MDEQGFERASGVIGIDHDDYLLDFTVPPGLMPDRQFDGLPAQLNVHRVRPLYANDQSPSVPIAVLIHGRTVTGPVVFDLRDPPGVTAPGGGALNLSVQKALAWQGIDTFVPSLLGYGKSTRFEKGLDDPGNASLRPHDPPNSSRCPYLEGCDRTLIEAINPYDQQKDMLFVYPLAEQRRAHSSKIRFARTDVWVRDIKQVIDDAIDRNKDDYGEGRDQVALVGYSVGGQRVGRALSARNPVVRDELIEKVSHVVFLNSLFGGPTEEPDPFMPPTFPLTLNDRQKPPGSASDNLWLMSSPPEDCPGRIIEGIKDQVWKDTMEHETVGREWGGDDPDRPPTGLNRSPTFSGYGWNPEVAGEMRTSTPTLVMQGLKDGTLPTGPFAGQAGPNTGKAIFDALPQSMTNKVLVQVECASHVLQWEGASSWPGPHSIFKQALIEWIKEGRFNRVPRGGFIVDKRGDVKRDPAIPS